MNKSNFGLQAGIKIDGFKSELEDPEPIIKIEELSCDPEAETEINVFRSELEDPDPVIKIEELSCDTEPETEIAVFKSELEDPEPVIKIEEFNCDTEPETEIDVFKSELEDPEPVIEIEEFNCCLEPEIEINVFKSELEDPENVVKTEESNCNSEPEVYVYIYEPEHANSNIDIEEFSCDQKTEIQPKPSVPDVISEHTDRQKPVSNIKYGVNVLKILPTLSCGYCEKDFDNGLAYVDHLNRHRENIDIAQQFNLLKRPHSSNIEGSNEVLRKSVSGNDLNSRSQTEISPTVLSGKKTIETPPKKQENSFKCRICMQPCLSQRDQFSHELSHRGPYACSLCEHVSQTVTELMFHRKRAHISYAGFSCDTCGKAFFSEAKLQEHRLMHDETNICNICGLKFVLKSTLINHIRSHDADSKYACSSSGKAFVQEDEEKKYICDICFAKYSRAESMRKHKRQKHSEHKTVFSCDVCSKKFQLWYHYTMHMRTHTAETRHVCGICDKRFLKRYHLQVHERVHTKKGPFKCELCDETFTQAHLMRSHMALHTEQKSPLSAASSGAEAQGEDPETGQCNNV